MVQVLRVSGMPGRALMWVKRVGDDRVVYFDKALLDGLGQPGPWKPGGTEYK